MYGLNRIAGDMGSYESLASPGFSRPHCLDLLTPPSSGNQKKSYKDLLSEANGDTPLSHRTNDCTSLPRAFHRKCNISIPEKPAPNLTTIKEEINEESGKFSDFAPVLVSLANLPTPSESPKSMKRLHAMEIQEDCPAKSAKNVINSKKVNYIMEEDKSRCELSTGVITPVSPDEATNCARILDFSMNFEPTVKYQHEKAIVNVTEKTPRKKSNLKLYTQTLVNPEQKENSPIKIIVDSGGWSKRTPRQLILRPPPIPLVLRSLGKEEKKVPVDFIGCLANRNMYHIIQQIMDHLDPMDLVSVEQVSHSWRQIATSVVSGKLCSARKLALTSKENLPLNSGLSAKILVKSSNEKTPRKVRDRNCIVSPKRRVPQSPDLSPRTKRFRAFLEEAKTLSPNKKLERCPKCRFPARAIDEDCATCSSCKITFCMQCRCNPHPFSTCNFVLALSSSPSPRKFSQKFCVMSKASKKSLRRLLH